MYIALLIFFGGDRWSEGARRAVSGACGCVGMGGVCGRMGVCGACGCIGV